MSTPENAKKVLIIDDETAVVSYLEMLLQDAGYATTTATNGQEGLEAVRRERPDLVTLDISMPETSGARFYKEVKTDPELSSIPVIIITAVTGFDGDPHAYEKFISGRRTIPSPEGFFPKPIDKKALLESVDELLS